MNGIANMKAVAPPLRISKVNAPARMQNDINFDAVSVIANFMIRLLSVA